VARATKKFQRRLHFIANGRAPQPAASLVRRLVVGRFKPPTAGRKARGKIWRVMRLRARRQKPKGKSSRGNIEVEIALALQTFYFCLLPFAFCLLVFALRRSRPAGFLRCVLLHTFYLPHTVSLGEWVSFI
jgi:hypothetical protein